MDRLYSSVCYTLNLFLFVRSEWYPGESIAPNL